MDTMNNFLYFIPQLMTMELPKFIVRSNPTANKRIEQWATENSFLFNTTHLLERDSPILVRKDQSQYEEKERFLSAIRTLISIRAYGNHVLHHLRHTTYLIHSNNGQLGTLRFLPWHRIYLFELEEMLQSFEQGITIPYWNWEKDRQIPDWLNNFTPDIISDNGTIPVDRRPAGAFNQFTLPTKEDVDKVLSSSTYEEFTLALEQGIAGNNGTETSMHNEVHNWVGGTMATYYSPADILFWLHHANVDRIWSIWQKEHQNEHPDLTGTFAIMTPWTDHNEEETRDIANLHYTYE
jgi:tyrosinase